MAESEPGDERPLRRLRVDLEVVSEALENRSDEFAYYLDLRTGEVAMFTEDQESSLARLLDSLGHEQGDVVAWVESAIQRDALIPEWEQPLLLDLHRVLELEREHYLRIADWESGRDAYLDMQAFIDTVVAEHRHELLEVAIQGPGAFRRFRDVLSRWDDEQTRWRDFERERRWQRATEWLAAEGVQALPKDV